MNNAILQLHQVAKSFKDKAALRDITLSVPLGSVLGLVGKNGAGKTTLFKCALGLLKPQGGDIRVFGEDAWNLSATAKARLGYVPQVVTLYPWMKVHQIIDYTASFYPRWNDSLVSDLTSRWELNPKDRIGPLSVGQLQKLAIILALGHEPELLLLDEPAASLDPAARRDFLKQILEIAAQGQRTVLFSTHITSDLERVADRVAILRDGRVIYDGQLDSFKDEIKRLHLTMAAPLPSGLALPGAIPGALPGTLRVEGREALVSVRGITPQMVADLGRQWQAQVEVRDLNLEDIFLEMHHV